MVRLSFFVFGYRKIRVAEEKCSKVASLFLRANITSYFNQDGSFSVREADYERVREALSDKIEYEASEALGIFGAYKRFRYKTVSAIAIIIMIALAVLSSSVVWDIRVEGNEKISDAKIIFSLSECGLSVGDAWRRVDRSRVETEFLSTVRDIAWININRRGTVAYVTVLETEEGNLVDIPTAPEGYSNIVATEACVIEEITVKRGVAEVKVGDAVKAGEVLISGVLPDELGGGFCYAEGEVVGRVSDTVCVEVLRNYEKKTAKNEKLIQIRVNFFKFCANIFKKYGNSTEGCDIIENIKTFSLSDKAKLPVEIISTYTVEYDSLPSVYSDAELVRIASYRLSSLVISRLSDADLLRIRTSGDYTDGGYAMRSDIVFLTNVGEPSSFFVK